MKKLLAALALALATSLLSGCSDMNKYYPQEDGYCISSSTYGCYLAVYNHRAVSGSVDLQPVKLTRGHLTSSSRVLMVNPDGTRYDANGSYGETISVSTNSAGGMNTTPLAQQQMKTQ